MCIRDRTYSPVYVPFFEAYASRDAWCNTTEKKITFIDENGDILRAIGEALDMARKYYVMIPSVNESAEDIAGREYIFKTDVYPTIQATGKQFDNRDVDWDIINMPLFQNPVSYTHLDVYKRQRQYHCRYPCRKIFAYCSG